MKLSCVIIDDEPIAIKGLVGYVDQIEFLELTSTFTNSVEALAFLTQNKTDIVFVDIQMPLMTGIDMVKSLEHKPIIIFTTAYREFGPEGFELEALDYLVKPISFTRFLKAAVRALDKSTKSNSKEKGDKEKVLVIGGGIMRITTSFYLSSLGYSVTCLEKNNSLVTGTSYINGGLICSHVLNATHLCEFGLLLDRLLIIHRSNSKKNISLDFS